MNPVRIHEGQGHSPRAIHDRTAFVILCNASMSKHMFLFELVVVGSEKLFIFSLLGTGDLKNNSVETHKKFQIPVYFVKGHVEFFTVSLWGLRCR